MPQRVSHSYLFGPFRFDARSAELRRDGTLIPLSPKAADLLCTLLDSAGDVLTKDELLSRVWKDANVEEGTLSFHIHLLRKALRNGQDDVSYIDTVPKRGYRFCFPVARETSNSADAHSDVQPSTVEPSLVPSLSARVTPAIEKRFPFRRWAWVAAIVAAAALTPVASRLAARDSPPPLIVGVHRISRTDVPTIFRSVAPARNRVFFNAPELYSIQLDRPGTIERAAYPGFLFLDICETRMEALAVRPGDVGADQSLWIVPLANGVPHRVGRIVASYAAWSPDCERIAYTFETTLAIIDRNGVAIDGSRSLAVGPSWPAWSPDGRSIRFSGRIGALEGIPTAIWEMDPNGGDLHRVLDDVAPAAAPCCGRWLPTGDTYVFEAGHPGNRQLWALRERRGLLGTRESELIQWTRDPIQLGAPVPSADGSRVFAVGTLPNRLMRFAGPPGFIEYLRGIDARNVTFSRDGQWLAYVRLPEHALWRAREDGRDARQITPRGMYVSGAEYSPDGKRLAVRARLGNGHEKVYVLPSNGGAPEPVTADDIEQGIPSWSMDGLRLTFGDVPENYGRPQGNERVHVFDLQRKLQSNLPGSDGLWTSRWSPDGRSIAAVTITERRLMIFDVATRLWRATAASHCEEPFWARDSRDVYCTPEGPEQSIRRISNATGEVTLVVDLRGRTFRWAGVMPDGTPLVLMSGGAVYQLDVRR